MLICSLGEGVFMTLHFSFSFCYYSHTGNCQLENNVSMRSRFDYDPRALADRGVKSIEELDLERLRRATDGKAAILHFFPQENHASQDYPDISDMAVVSEERVVTTETEPLPPTLPAIASQFTSADEILEAALKPLSFAVVKQISDETIQQRDDNLWFAVRTGRITASKLKRCKDRVDLAEGKVKGENELLPQGIFTHNKLGYLQ